MIYSFFFVRKIIAHIFAFFFYCIVLPATILVPEVTVPKWGGVYIPTIITLLNSVGTPRFSFLSSSFFSIPVLVKCNNSENFSFPKINRNVYPFLSIPSDFDGFFFLFYNFADQSTWWSSGSYSRTSCPYTVQKLRSLVY